MDALDEGMSWRRFTVLWGGLSADAVWRLWRGNRPLEGTAAEHAFEMWKG